MSWWASGIQTGLSLFGANKKIKAGRMARRLAGMNADYDKIETQEKRRRMFRDFQQIEGEAIAIAAGSGFSQREGDSQSRYIAEMIAEHGRQLKFETMASRKRQEIIRLGGTLAYKEAKADAIRSIGQGIGHLGNMVSGLG